MSDAQPLPKPEDIKLIVCDVDGTLLDSDHLLPETSPTYKVLRRIRDTIPDLPVVISTGKPYPAAAVLRQQLSLDVFNAVHLNGNVLYAPGGSVISQTGLDVSIVLEVYDKLKEAGFSFFVYDTDRPWQVLPFASVGDKPWDQVLRSYGEDCQPLSRAEEIMPKVRSGETKVVKMAICEIESYLPKVREVLSTFPPSAFASTQGLPICIELIPSQYNKGTALRLLLDHMNSSRPEAEHIGLENVIAFGDAANDVPMLEIAGISVSMGNAMSVATQAATWSTATNDEGGVGLFLEKIFFP